MAVIFFKKSNNWTASIMFNGLNIMELVKTFKKQIYLLFFFYFELVYF